MYRVSSSLQDEILARLKILAALRIDEHQQPQDGRFRFELSETSIDVRVSIAPTYYGERAVLRLLYPLHAFSDLSLLGFSIEQKAILEEAIQKPHGMILLTGPTGSGKTSTLYALLHLLASREISITTIEDPVEYAIEGIMQISAGRQNGISFDDGLRSILRQDPNVIAIGEIRDLETAELATHAALTGHRVLSTLHANDALSAIPRLMNMGIEPYVLSSTVRLVVNQRLVRRKNEVGRTGIMEVLVITPELSEAIRASASASELFALARGSGMQILLEAGMEKATAGMVMLEDVLALDLFSANNSSLQTLSPGHHISV
jgi:type II secretory ATPase GspE/PulE/Tfp pilus assembly ATPase PilB-like protein